MATPNHLPQFHAYVTTHDGVGSSVFEPSLPSVPSLKPIIPSTANFTDLHATARIPVNLSADLATTASEIRTNKLPANMSGLGAAFRITETAPGAISPMHRTLSLDYGVVLAGEIELVLESGETRLLRAGDTIVQRATMHQWRNVSRDQWCRMAVVMLPIEEGTSVGQGDDSKVLETEFRVPGKD